MFYSDRPIDSGTDDKLNRSGFAKALAHTLANLDSEDTFTVGLFGKWGCGKTSLVNMTLAEIKQIQEAEENTQKTVVVHFDPWNFTDSNQLLTQFLVRMANEFSKSSDKALNKAGKALENYSYAFGLLELIPIVGGPIAAVSKTGVAKIGRKLQKGLDERDVSKQKDYVVKLLKEQKNRILVVIDDIDRLSNDQIRYVFQLITSVAKFPNTTYLLVFDKGIVVQALKDVQSGNGEDYLEKIIQMPIQIPDIQSNQLRSVLSNQLDAILSNYPDISFVQAHWQRLFEPCVAPFIIHLRDINRLCNTLQFKLSGISSEVDFTDMVVISLLEIHHPAVYEWIKSNKQILTGENDLSRALNSNETQKDLYKKYATIFKDLVQCEEHVYDVDAIVEALLNCLAYLFPYFGQTIGLVYEAFDRDKLAKYNQIAHPDKYDRYFLLNIDNLTYRTADVKACIYDMPEAEILNFLKKQDCLESSYEFLKDIKARILDISSERAKTLSNALFKALPILKTGGSHGLFSVSASSYAEYMMLDILEKVSAEERTAFISNLVSNADVGTLPWIASVINMIELGYGRLAANGKEREYKKVISLEALEDVEIIFIGRTKKLLETNSLFDFSKWQIIFYLLSAFDPKYTSEYLVQSLNNSINVLYFVGRYISAWTGIGTEYEIQKGYEEFLSKEKVLSAIDACIFDGSFFTMPIEDQRKNAAFYLNDCGKNNHHGNISQIDADMQIEEWKHNLSVPMKTCTT